jgi:hypothetical protein
MRRRDFIKGVAGSATAWPLAARAQPSGKLPTIGFLGASSLSAINIDSGHASFKLDTRYSGCRRTLDYLLSIHSLKQAATQPAHDRVENNSAKRAGAYHHGRKY